MALLEILIKGRYVEATSKTRVLRCQRMELERYIPYEAFPHSWEPKGPIKCFEIAAVFGMETDLLKTS